MAGDDGDLWWYGYVLILCIWIILHGYTIYMWWICVYFILYGYVYIYICLWYVYIMDMKYIYLGKFDHDLTSRPKPIDDGECKGNHPG